MNRTTTVSGLAKTQPPDPPLEHEIRLRAYDLYEQQGRMDGHAKLNPTGSALVYSTYLGRSGDGF
jgi:DUF2934 family protein